MIKSIVLIFFSTTILLGQKNYPKLLDKYMQAQAELNEFTGSVLVAHRGKVIYEKAFGFADRELNVPNTIQTKFQIASVTKQFTAASILKLVEEGKLKLDDKLSRFYPDFPKADSISIHMLLSHTSGIKNYTDLPVFWEKMALPVTKDSMIALFKKQPFDFSPGSKHSYSNSGYFLLGCIIEKTSGQSYSDYLYKNIFEKVGLKNTMVNRWDTILPNRAKGYESSKNGWKNTKFISMEGPYSAGAIISTPRDLYIWTKALFDKKIIPQGLLSKMITAYKDNYGYGIVVSSYRQHLLIYHEGGIPGFASFLASFPNDEIVVVCLSNNEKTLTHRVAIALANIVLNNPVIVPYKHKEIQTDSSHFQYKGIYRVENDTSNDTIFVKENKLFWRQNHGGLYEMKPESKTKFFVPDLSDIQLEFGIKDAFIIKSGVKYEFKKY